jgi:putative FmdB family regulatory protein
MPIYAYACDSCSFSKDVLQKLSEAPLTTCPSCGKETFSKRLTAPAFQLKGSGWYVTDFRDNKGKTSEPATGPKTESVAAPTNEKTSGASSDTSTASSPAAAPTTAAPAPSSGSTAG